MPFRDNYSLKGFKQFVAEQEHRARHLFHENAHEWIALRLGAKKVSRTIGFGGTSKVELEGIGSVENHYKVAVAGLLGEAKGIKSQLSPECLIDIERRMAGFAHVLFEVTKHWPSDPNSEFGIEPDVPMTCPMASTEWGGLSVADLARPIAHGLTEKGLHDGLIAVATSMNDPDTWANFLRYYEDNQG